MWVLRPDQVRHTGFCHVGPETGPDRRASSDSFLSPVDPVMHLAEPQGSPVSCPPAPIDPQDPRAGPWKDGGGSSGGGASGGSGLAEVVGLVVNYTQVLWERVRSPHDPTLYNGYVETLSTMLGNLSSSTCLLSSSTCVLSSSTCLLSSSTCLLSSSTCLLSSSTCLLSSSTCLLSSSTYLVVMSCDQRKSI
ncbi:hypothetical protein CRUP_015064 [Coryphaenoides rupestris]|nr:hypothetical protein CRUP_015064 [Coryphaenoides rupestris]